MNKCEYVNKTLRLVHINTVSTASNKQAFSKLKIVKNYLKSTKTAKHLNNSMVLNFNKNILNNIDMEIHVKK